MIMARSHGTPKRRKPRALNQAGVSRELGTGNATGVDRVHVVGIMRKFGFLEFLGLLREVLDANCLSRIRRPVDLSDEAVVGVLAGIHRAGFVKLPHQHGSQQMVHGERIVRMAGQQTN